MVDQMWKSYRRLLQPHSIEQIHWINPKSLCRPRRDSTRCSSRMCYSPEREKHRDPRPAGCLVVTVAQGHVEVSRLTITGNEAGKRAKDRLRLTSHRFAGNPRDIPNFILPSSSMSQTCSCFVGPGAVSSACMHVDPNSVSCSSPSHNAADVVWAATHFDASKQTGKNGLTHRLDSDGQRQSP
ncbi:hypothetical protein B0J12DRAFT_218899 [Macrophomina phaseolina]|uniref:Uncharacterized protein n=1 Tax=Macrophomina phaseolina TaxID=35725 RepID=A0ABQ8G176_9PEZI|nr:hypothetical protein B0J12DRAFT_218899 [Macrophomina phaseolina]